MTETSSKNNKQLFTGMMCLSFSAMFMMAGYDFIRQSAASIFISDFGAARMPYAMTAIPFAMALLVWLYGRLLSLAGTRKAFAISLGAIFAVFFVCYSMILAKNKWASAVFYVFGETYVMVLVEQVWSLVNSTITAEQAKKINGPLIGGAALGPLAADFFMTKYTTSVGTDQMILIGAATLVPVLVLTMMAFRLCGEPKPARTEEGTKDHLGLKTLFSSRTLTILAGMVFLSQVISTVINLYFYQLAEAAFPLKDQRTTYFAQFWMYVSLIGLPVQFILTPLLMSKVKARVVMAAIPCIHVVMCVLLAFSPILPIAAAELLIFKIIDYSVFRASKETLYIPLGFDARYRAKQVVDAFTYRFSKGVTAGAISGYKLLAGGLGALAYPVSGAAAAALWTLISVRLLRTETENPQ